MSESENLFQVYRRGNDPTTSMEWAILVHDGGVDIRAGQTGRPATLTEVPQQSCNGGIPELEARTQIESKLEAGYRLIGKGTYHSGKLVLHKSEPQAGDELYWEVAKPIPEKGLRELLKEIGDSLFAHTAQCAMVRAKDGQDVAGLLVPTPGGEWAFGQHAGGGLHSDGRGGGVIARAQGVVPVLVLLRVAREFPEAVAFADARAEAVTPRLSADDAWIGREAAPIEETQALATALGLCPAAQVVVNEMEDQGARPLFF